MGDAGEAGDAVWGDVVGLGVVVLSHPTVVISSNRQTSSHRLRWIMRAGSFPLQLQLFGLYHTLKAAFRYSRVATSNNAVANYP